MRQIDEYFPEHLSADFIFGLQKNHSGIDRGQGDNDSQAINRQSTKKP